ncbi:MAG: hypothetical protein DMG09_04365 [Acidobacteria bacterium]|nr:MAG: hypothetical protein DMG09_04365 [Acidobacteriota bacterium]
MFLGAHASSIISGSERVANPDALVRSHPEIGYEQFVVLMNRGVQTAERYSPHEAVRTNQSVEGIPSLTEGQRFPADCHEGNVVYDKTRVGQERVGKLRISNVKTTDLSKKLNLQE